MLKTRRRYAAVDLRRAERESCPLGFSPSFVAKRKSALQVFRNLFFGLNRVRTQVDIAGIYRGLPTEDRRRQHLPLLGETVRAYGPGKGSRSRFGAVPARKSAMRHWCRHYSDRS